MKNGTSKITRFQTYSKFVVLCICFFMSISSIHAQQIKDSVLAQKPMKIVSKNDRLIGFLELIRQQTGLKTDCDTSIINIDKLVNLKDNKLTLIQLVQQLAIQTGYKFQVNNQTLSVTKPQVKPNQSNRNLQGMVVDAVDGRPIESVTVKIKGFNSSAITSKEGAFTLKVPTSEKQPLLVFTSVGYKQKEMLLGGTANNIQVKLESLSDTLKDVVVVNTGYMKIRKKDLTGSIGSVSVEELQKAPVITVDAALAGRIAGVQVVSPDGEPGANADIVIRGVGSLSQSSGPLYVIDGFPQEAANFNALNPNDIESMEVLKDASSTAIYGARGSNGVILITTKRGKSPKPTLNYNTQVGVQSPIKLMKLLSPYEFVRLQNDVNPFFANYVYFANGKTLEDYKTANYIDWQKICSNASPKFQNHNLSLSGKNNKSSYLMSLSYSASDGFIVASGVNRLQSRFVFDQEVTDKLKIGLNLNYARVKAFGQTPSTMSTPTGQTVSNAFWNYMFNLWAYRPVQTARSQTTDSAFIYDNLIDIDPESGGAPGSPTVNPYLTAINEVRDRFNTTISANGYITYQINKNLLFKSTLGLLSYELRNENFNNSKTNSGSPLTTSGRVNGANGSISSARNISLLNENTLTYSKRISSKTNFNAVLGYTAQTFKTESLGFASIRVVNENLGIKGLSTGTPSSNTYNASESAVLSYLARANYNLLGKYLFTASFRADGSSKFHKSNRWGYFPSAAFAWRMSDETFLNKIRLINDAKFRISYGATGNNRVGDFASSALVATNANALNYGSYYTFNETNVYNAIVTQVGNQYLKWERGHQINYGLDVTLLRNKINFSVDYYIKRTNDLLVSVAMPANTGVNSAFVNVGNIKNAGLELSLSTVNIKKKFFSWSSAFNITFNVNTLTALNANQDALMNNRNIGQALTNNNFIAKVNSRVASFYGMVSDGMYQLDDFYKVPNGANSFLYVLKEGIPYYGNKSTLANINTTSATSVQPGDVKFKDINGDGIIDGNDLTVIGNPFPKHFGGFTNNFSYKQFDLSIFCQWSFGNQILNVNRIMMEGGTNAPQSGSSISTNLGMVNTNQFASYANRWTLSNPSNLYPRVNANAFGLRQYSTRIVEDGSYLRVKTVQLSYGLSNKFLRRYKITSCKVFVSMQNLLTITRYTGPDPEVSVGSGSPLTPGVDYSPYPRMKVTTLGLNITL